MEYMTAIPFTSDRIAMKIVLVLAVCLLCHCSPAGNQQSARADESLQSSLGQPLGDPLIREEGMTVLDRFAPPPGYSRRECEDGSFAAYLRSLPLRKSGEKVRYYDGSFKENAGIYEAVVDLPVGNRDLHQCADAVMRLRAEYLYREKAYEDIHFNFTNGFRVDYSEWIKGNRIQVKGNHVSWQKGGKPSTDYTEFWSYLETIFMYAGTLSLSREMRPVDIASMQPGDVFIQGGSPGHAVIVVDMAQNEAGTEKLFMLAQSYMPAQEIQILSNPNDRNLSPWYSLDFGEQLISPEWVFSSQDLKRFVE